VRGAAPGRRRRLTPGPLTRVSLGRCNGLPERGPEQIVNHVEGHPRVGRPGAVHCSPAGVGRDDLRILGVTLSGNEVTRRSVRAEPLGEEIVQPSKVVQLIVVKVRKLAVCAAVAYRETASGVGVMEARSNNEDTPLTTDSQQPFEV
jgi:hypothetical protein